MITSFSHIRILFIALITICVAMNINFKKHDEKSFKDIDYSSVAKNVPVKLERLRNFISVKYVPPDEARKILRVAVESGINFYDTSPDYGSSERLVGEIKKKNLSNIFSRNVMKIVVKEEAGLKRIVSIFYPLRLGD